MEPKPKRKLERLAEPRQRGVCNDLWHCRLRSDRQRGSYLVRTRFLPHGDTFVELRSRQLYTIRTTTGPSAWPSPSTVQATMRCGRGSPRNLKQHAQVNQSRCASLAANTAHQPTINGWGRRRPAEPLVNAGPHRHCRLGSPTPRQAQAGNMEIADWARQRPAKESIHSSIHVAVGTRTKAC